MKAFARIRRFTRAMNSLALLLLVCLLTSGIVAAPSQRQTTLVPPPEPQVKPFIVHPIESDTDISRVSDNLEHRLRTIKEEIARASDRQKATLQAKLEEPVRVELIFDRQITQRDIDNFLAVGDIDYIFQVVSYGWVGVVPLRVVEILPKIMGDSLVAALEDKPVLYHMDEATRTARVRPVWAPGFAGRPLGYSGSPNTTIGVIDTGCDDSHADLAGRLAYWKDWTSDREKNPVDYDGHGTHVTAVALGTGTAAGTDTISLMYTDSGDMSALPAGYFYPSPIHIPGGISATFNSTATWLGGGSTDLYGFHRLNGNVGSYNALSDPSSGASPLSESNSFVSESGRHYSAGLVQNSTSTITRYAVTNTVTYAGVGDGFNTFRGVAPACRWACCKVFSNTGIASTTDIAEAIDDLVSKRTTYNIKVMNISLGVRGDPGIDTTLRAKVNTAVNNGIVVVCSAGNDGPGTNPTNWIDDPARASLAITVAASNDINELTKYSSTGFPSPGTDEDYKPDLVAPGGSVHYSLILAADSNDSDARSANFPDQRANDYANMGGTSAAAPVVAGAAALVIQGLEENGLVWSFSSASCPLRVKMLLCATATELNAPREVNSGNDPLLGRATSPKDLCEGYGLVNVDAAVEAVCMTYDGSEWVGTTGGGYYDRRAWARKINLTAGNPVNLFLSVPPSGDFDIYLYAGTPDSKGNPIIRASGTLPGNGVSETIQFTPTITETGYLVVKRVSGFGTWTLMGPDSTPPPTPEVTDDGTYTSNREQLHASWISADPESGIVEYKYAVSSTPDESGIVQGGEWESVGVSPEAVRTGINLSYGNVYYVLVKARNAAGLWSNIGKSDGIMVVQYPNVTISQAKLLPDDATVGLSAKVITAVLGGSGCFYIQESSRFAGIRVAWASGFGSLAIGKLIEVAGWTGTFDGERQIRGVLLQTGAGTNVEPLWMNNRAVGGTNWQYDPATGVGQRGVEHGSGLSNIGLLVTTSGKVTFVDGNDFWIDDGSAVSAEPGHVGIRVRVVDLPMPSVGQYVSVTGVSSCTRADSALYPLIRATSLALIP